MSFMESTHEQLMLEELNHSYQEGHRNTPGRVEGDLTMTDLNEEDRIQTPSKIFGRIRSQRVCSSYGKGGEGHGREGDKLDGTDGNSTLQESEGLRDKIKQNQLDIIAKKVNQTIQELNEIYQEIGFSATEIAFKKSEIFTAIDETISNFKSGLLMEKNSIENECEWLRQQIRIILAMVDDRDGENSLPLLSRGIVMNSTEMYELGFKEELQNKIHSLRNRRNNFYANSPFNITSTDITELSISMEREYERLLDTIPELSLIQKKSKLNSIFLEVLKVFVKSFKKINELNIIYMDLREVLGDFSSPSCNTNLVRSLPTRENSESYQELLDQFEITLKYLNLNDDTKPEPLMTLNDKKHKDNAYIISSPKKASAKLANEVDSNESFDGRQTEDMMGQLRDLNYKIVRVIRSLKFTKITSDFVHDLTTEIESCEAEFNNRRNKVKSTIEKCFDLIDTLKLNREQLIAIQTHYFKSKNKNKISSDNFFDQETLDFIQKEPRQFGLHSEHIKFIQNFYDMLENIRSSKQKKWDYYSGMCNQLWQKLGETKEYTENFLDANSSLTDNSLMNFKMELNRLYAKRSEYIESFIVDARKEIETLWEKMCISPDERSKFKYYTYDMQDEMVDKETVLHEHELKLFELNKEYEIKQPILTKYAQLQDLLKDQQFLIDSSKDSSRLLSKNSCKILLNEERIRKRILKNLPRLLETLKADVINFNSDQLNQGGKPFLLDGEDLYEKVLLVEIDQMEKLNGRKVKSKPRMAVDANKISKSLNASPARSATKVPVSHGRRSVFSSLTRSRGRGTYSPKHSPSRTSNILNVPKFPETRTANKMAVAGLTTKNKIGQSVNHSLTSSSDGSGSLESPARDASRSNSNLTKFLGTHLAPLHSPLTSLKHEDANSILPDIQDDTNYSNLSKMSPLRINTTVNINSTDYYGLKAKRDTKSPVAIKERQERTGINERNKVEDKENADVGSNFTLSPIKVSDFGSDTGAKSLKRRTSTMTCDSSTILGDEYQDWRNERIRQLNNDN